MRKYGYVQQIIEEFDKSPDMVRVIFIKDLFYSNANSCRCAYRRAIKNLGCNIKTRVINGDLYLIKIQNPNWTAESNGLTCIPCSNRYPSKACSTCVNGNNFTFAE